MRIFGPFFEYVIRWMSPARRPVDRSLPVVVLVDVEGASTGRVCRRGHRLASSPCCSLSRGNRDGDRHHARRRRRR
jgi:hypothetical protein